MDLMKLGSELLMSKLGGNASADGLSSVLGNLLGGGDSGSGGGLSSLMSAMQEKGLGSIAESWLGDGDNEEISTDQVKDIVGSDKIAEMASQLNTDENSLLSGLKDALPQMVDKSSSGGSLLDSIGGLDGALGMAKKFFS
ncbi:MAG TPA: DUF937 domain-containing protein [Gammaproteobacteria bacterium]|nr:DUF937 domain-containing protein [Gammaproteobacteria bacterium]